MAPEFTHRFGFNVFNQPPEKLFAYASENNLKHIEINLTQEHSSLESFDSQRIATIVKQAEAHDVELSLHLPYSINISDIIVLIRRANFAYLQKCVQLAAQICATHITAHIGNYYWFPANDWMKQKALDRFIKYLRRIIPQCEQHNVRIALENVVPIPRGSEFYLLGDCIGDFSFIFSKIDSDCLRFCLDTGHANMAEGVIEYIRTLHDRLVSIHYHDNKRNNDEHLPIGNGTIPWPDVAQELHTIGYDGPFISECRNIQPHEAAMKMQSYFNNIQKLVEES